MGVLDRSKTSTSSHKPLLTVEAVVFDLDGTLLDTEVLYRDAFMDAAKSLGIAIPPAVYGDLVGIATRERGVILRRHLGKSFPWDALRTAYYAIRNERVRTGLRVKAGAPSLLRHIERLGLGKAVATSASRETAEAHLQSVGLRNFFNVIITRDDVARGKPYPDVFIAAAERIGVPPRLCLALEDSEPGVASAWFAGMLPLMVTTASPNNAVRARSVGIVSDLNEVRALLCG